MGGNKETNKKIVELSKNVLFLEFLIKNRYRNYG